MSLLHAVEFAEEADDIKDRVVHYWSNRADSFLDQRISELNNVKAGRWVKTLTSKIPAGKTFRILDVGCGAGFFEVLLGRLGHEVIGIDLTEEMVQKANTLIAMQGVDAVHARAKQMDAEKLDFEDESFDMVITRNLTWTLPHPIDAYREWNRVLKKGGILLNFDAEYAKGAHKYDDRENIAHKVISKELKDECHEIYHMLTVSTLDRPSWDKEILEQVGFSEVSFDEEYYKYIFAEKDEFYVPDHMFMISAVK